MVPEKATKRHPGAAREHPSPRLEKFRAASQPDGSGTGSELGAVARRRSGETITLSKASRAGGPFVDVVEGEHE